MKSRDIGKFISEKVGLRSKADNFAINPAKVVEYIDGSTWDRNVNNTPRWDKAALYIGKMSRSENNLYSDENLIGMLRFAVETNHQKEKINLILCPILYQSLASEEAKADIMSFAEQKKHILTLIKKAKLPSELFAIHDLASGHQELFSAVREKDIDALSTKTPLRHVASPKSVEIAQYLYGLTQKYPDVKKNLLSAMPEDLKGNLPKDDPLHYYGMLEIACRLHDLARWVTMQWGMIRQKKFDEIMSYVLNLSEEEIPEIKELHRWLASNKQPALSKWYFKNKAYKELVVKEDHEKNRKMKKKYIIAMVAASLGSVLIWWTAVHEYMKNVEKSKYKEKMGELLKQKLKYEKLWLGFHFIMDDKTYNESPEKKVELVNYTTDRIYKYILKRYAIDPREEDALRGLIQNELLKKNRTNSNLKINDVNRDMDQAGWFAYHFIENELIPNNKIALEGIWMDTRPYSNLLKEQRLFENIIHKKDSLTLIKDQYTLTDPLTHTLTRTWRATSVEHLWTFISDSYDQEYDLVKVIIDQQGGGIMPGYHEELLVAKSIYSQDEMYSVDVWKSVAKELLALWEKSKSGKEQK